MSHLTNSIVLALLSTTANALPGLKGGPSFGGHGHPSFNSHQNNDWRHGLDLDKLHPTCPEGFPEILFYDNFATYEPGSQPDPTKWTIDIGHKYPSLDAPDNWGTGEKQYYTDDERNLVITEQGTLRIAPLRPEDSIRDEWTSARIETTEEWDFRAKPGQKLRIQAAIKLGDEPQENQLGIWPAFWSLGSDYRGVYNNWPRVGEIDILESANGLPFSWQALHCGYWIGNDGGPCNEPNGIASEDGWPFSRGEWHVVSVDIDRTKPGDDWREEKIVWRIDGKVVFTVKGSDVGDRTYWLNITDKDHMILLNVAVGGAFPDKIANVPQGTTPTAATVGGIRSSLEAKYVIVFASHR